MSPGGARNDVRLVRVVSDAMVSTQQQHDQCDEAAQTRT